MRGLERRSHPRKLIAFVVAACALFALAGTARAETRTQKDSLEPALISRINQVRAQNHLPALKGASLLTTAATKHANNLAIVGAFRHEFRKNGSWVTFGTWIRWYWPGPGYSAWTAGENLAWGAPDISPAQTVTAWMNSPGHRANLLGAWTSVGVSIVHVGAPPSYYRDYPEVTIVAAEFGRRT